MYIVNVSNIYNSFFFFLLAQKWLDSTHRCGVLDLPPSVMLVLSCCSSIQR